MLRYMGPLFVVDDLGPIRRFYEELLGQGVKYDFGQNVTFEGDFAFHLRSFYQDLVGAAAQPRGGGAAHDAVLGFECDDIDALLERLRSGGARFVHELEEQPWGQRVMRLYDPAGHIVEIGEAMDMVVRRLHGQGLSEERICEATGMPPAFVAQALQDRADAGGQRCERPTPAPSAADVA